MGDVASSQTDRRPVPIDLAIEERIKALKINPQTAANLMRVSHQNIGNWLVKKRVPHPFFLRQIASFLDVTMATARTMRGEMQRLKRLAKGKSNV